MKKQDYIIKDEKYFKNVRLDIVGFIKNQKGLTVLDIGGGSGGTLLFLKEQGIATKIHLFDIVDQTKDKNVFNSITIGDINTTQLYDEKYDVIILSDVIEHMIDPNILINKAKKKLKKNGKLLISLPNIQFIKAMYKVFVKGSFEYEKSGIFDKTHMRFYCKSDMIKLFNNHGDLVINKVFSVNKFVNSKLSFIDKITFGLFSQWLSMQYLLEIEKKE
tara:strand:- start:339 stop:992 length:654 start_codon:yes stop_codon:yes gene_type:complete